MVAHLGERPRTPVPSPPSAFVGREAELGRLLAALGEAGAGRAPAIVVEGESGAGKTRLLKEFAAIGAARGATILSGRCIDCGDAGPPYWAFTEALRPLGGARAADGTGDGSTRYFEAVLTRLEEAGRRSPAALALDDLHWADRSTRDLLGFLLANLAGGPGPLLVVTVRSEALVPGHPLRALLGELRRSRRAEFLHLDRLDMSAVAAQLASILGETPEPDLVEEIWRRSEGNPFFVEELLAAFRAGRELTSTLLPILGARLGELSPSARAAAGAVAASVGPVGHELLREVAGLAELTLLAGLRECVDAHILIIDSVARTYSFRHDLMRETAYADLLPGEAARLHSAYGRALDLTLPVADMAAVAWHLYAAGDASHGLPATIAAGMAAEEAAGYGEAHVQYERALDLAGRLHPAALETVGGKVRIDQVWLAERAADVAILAGVPGRAVELLEMALVGGGPEDTSRMQLGLGRARTALGDTSGALEAYDEAIALLADPETAEGVGTLAACAEARMLAGRYGESNELAESGLTVARRLELPVVEAEILGTLGVNRAFLGDAESAVAALDEAVKAAEKATGAGPRPLARALLNRAEVLSGPLNQLGVAAEVAAAGLEPLRKLGLDRSYAASLAAVLANTLFRAGRWDEADSILDAALARRPTGAAAIELMLARARLAVGRGRFDGARQDLSRLDLRWTQAVAPRYRAPLLTLEAGLALWEGRTVDARAAVARALELTAGSGDVWLVAALLWHGLRAEGDRAARARAIGDRAEARLAVQAAAGLVERTLALHDRVAPAVRPVVAAYEALSLAEGMRARGADEAGGPPAWTEAAKRWDGLDQPYPAAYALFREAEALLAQKARSARAAWALRSAHRVAVRLGAEPFRRDVEALAKRARLPLQTPQVPIPAGRPAAPAPQGRGSPGRLDSLTAREIDVLGLVVEGRTNREIAGALFIAEKTASVHVSHILAKLGVRSRVQAVAVAHQVPS